MKARRQKGILPHGRFAEKVEVDSIDSKSTTGSPVQPRRAATSIPLSPMGSVVTSMSKK